MISIIVPIHNQEKYLKKCLDSIISQTYKNLEIILVIDNSNDDSLSICNEYAQIDNRICIIKVEYNDISSTRNAGVLNATGDIIGFVDPDDWIEEDMFEYLLKIKNYYDADIACCGKQEVLKEEDILKQPNKIEVEEMNGYHATEVLISENKIRSHLWNKIYDRKLFQGISFEEGRVYEDFLVMHKLFLKSKKVVFSNYIMYHYRQHPSSTLAKTNIKKKLDGCHAAKVRYTDLIELYPECRNLMIQRFQFNVLALLEEIKKTDFSENKKYIIEFNKIQQQYKKFNIHSSTLSEKIFISSPYVFIYLFTLKRKLKCSN